MYFISNKIIFISFPQQFYSFISSLPDFDNLCGEVSKCLIASSLKGRCLFMTLKVLFLCLRFSKFYYSVFRSDFICINKLVGIQNLLDSMVDVFLWFGNLPASISSSGVPVQFLSSISGTSDTHMLNFS